MLLATACAAADRSATGPHAVEALIGDAACDTDAQCRTIGVGAKACGGPQAHLAWSTLRTDPAQLRSAVDKQAALERDTMAAQGMASTCSVVPDPGARCDRASPAGGRAGRCRLHAGSGGAAVR